jgi:hypothetical protein
MLTEHLSGDGSRTVKQIEFSVELLVRDST